ncbi:hypothetical protein IW262DRAFT_1465701 [Armillaria fumosa]|nr:hypothetical protein IW262DRAFT_1465701 [Armillaria fumosa]
MLHALNERRAAHRGLERRLGPTPSSMLSTTTNPLESLISSLSEDSAETTLTIRSTSTSTDSVTTTRATSTATSSTHTTTSTSTSTSTSSPTSTTTTSTTTSSTQSSTTSLSTSSSSSSSSSHLPTSSTPSVEATISSTHTTGTVSVTVSGAAESASSSAVASASASSTGGTSNTGAIIGGVAAGIIGLALVIGMIGFFLRRWRTKRRERDEFDASQFRRSAVMMQDPPPDPGNDHPYNPRPPSMLERRNHPMSFGTQYGAPGPIHPPERSQTRYDMGMDRGYSPPSATNSANPLFAPAMYRQADDTPRPTPAPLDTPQYVYSHDLDDGPLPSPVYGLGGPTIPPSASVNRASGNTVSRDVSSVVTYEQSVYRPSMTSSAPRQSLPIPANDYIDVTRSSVTPFQAAQYVEIANRLATEVPQGLDTPAVNEYVHSREASLATIGSGAPPVVPPKDSHYSQASNSTGSQSPKRTSGQSQASVDIMKDLEFPAPPSPVLSTSSRYRVDSAPPTLPEIAIDRGSVSQYSLPSSYRDSTGSAPQYSPFPGSGSGFPSGVSQTITVGGKLGPQSRFPTTPSPLGNSFVMSENRNQFPSSPTPSSPTIPEAKVHVQRPETIYDAEDAYGGI